MTVTAVQTASALLRTDQAYHTQLGPPEPLPCGSAYCAQSFAGLPDANQIRDVLLQDLSAADAFALIESYFAERQRRCLRWALAMEQAAEPVAEHLAALGWLHRPRTVWGLEHWPEHNTLLHPPPAAPGLRILPARAMRKAFRQMFVAGDDPSDGLRGEELADAAAERLNDSNYDVFVGQLDGAAVGRIGLLEVGDICRVEDLHIARSVADRGVGEALLMHVLQLAYRLRPRVVVAATSAGTERATGAAVDAMLESFGFRPAGQLEEWQRP